MAKDIDTMPITKTAKAKAYLLRGDIKSCLRIMKTFRVGITKSEKRCIEIGYECLSGNDRLYRQIGIDVQNEIERSKDIAAKYFA